MYTDDAMAYDSLKGYNHQTVKHSVKQFIDGMAHTKGIESFWALLKRGYYDTYHHMSPWQLQRYVMSFLVDIMLVAWTQKGKWREWRLEW